MQGQERAEESENSEETQENCLLIATVPAFSIYGISSSVILWESPALQNQNAEKSLRHGPKEQQAAPFVPAALLGKAGPHGELTGREPAPHYPTDPKSTEGPKREGLTLGRTTVGSPLPGKLLEAGQLCPGEKLSPRGGEHSLPHTGPWSSLSIYCHTSQLPAWLATNNLLQISVIAQIRQSVSLPLNSLQSLTQLGTQLVLIKILLDLNLLTFPCPHLHPCTPAAGPGMHPLLTFLRAGEAGATKEGQARASEPVDLPGPPAGSPIGKQRITISKVSN